MVGASVATHFWHLRTFPLESLPFRRLWQAPVAQWLEQQTHNLLVRGSNPCGGTNQLARVLTLTSLRCWADRCSTSRWREDGVIWEVRDSRVMKSVPSAVADGSNDPLGSTRDRGRC